MSKKDIEILLEDYTSHIWEKDALEKEVEKLKAEVITPEIMEKLAEIDEEFTPALENVNQRISEAESAIKNKVRDLGETVRNDVFMAVYAKPRVTWDTKILKMMAKYVPEVKWAMKEGNPSVSIRRVR